MNAGTVSAFSANYTNEPGDTIDNGESAALCSLSPAQRRSLDDRSQPNVIQRPSYALKGMQKVAIFTHFLADRICLQPPFPGCEKSNNDAVSWKSTSKSKSSTPSKQILNIEHANNNGQNKSTYVFTYVSMFSTLKF